MVSLEAARVLGDGSGGLGALALETHPISPVLSSPLYNFNAQPRPDSNPDGCWLPASHLTPELVLNLDF